MRGRLPGFLEARKKGHTAQTQFWPALWEEWFEKWPEACTEAARVPADIEDPVKLAEVQAAYELEKAAAISLRKTVSQFKLNFENGYTHRAPAHQTVVQ